MHCEADYDRLELLFRRANSLPELPGSALRLIHVIDSGAASAIDLERVIASDPGLSANLLRISNARIPGVDAPGISTLRAAIMRLGQRSVRTLAVSLILQNISHGKDVAPEFHVDRFARHCLFVAFLSRYLYARRQLSNPFESQWSADEIFAGGLLHDIGIALLARAAPESFLRVYSFAVRTSISFEASFYKIYQQPLSQLSRTAIEAWALPDLFTSTLCYMHEPWLFGVEYTALCCLNYANYLACTHGLGTEEWSGTTALIPEVQEEIALPAEEVEKVLDYVNQQVTSYLKGSEAEAA
jgi:HD-like signal output (HDOD) protein